MSPLVGGCRGWCGSRSGFGRGRRRRIFLERIDGLDRAIVVVVDLDRLLDVAQMRVAVRYLAVVVEDVPLAIHLGDRVVVSPSQHGLEDLALVGERSVR